MGLGDILQLEKEKMAVGYNPSDVGGGMEAGASSFLKTVFGEIDRRRKLKETESEQEFQMRKLEAMFGREKLKSETRIDVAKIGAEARKKVAESKGPTGGKDAPSKLFSQLSTLYKQDTETITDPISKTVIDYKSNKIAKMSASPDIKERLRAKEIVDIGLRRKNTSDRMFALTEKNPELLEQYNKLTGKKTQPDEFGFTLGQEEKGYKYIGKNQWQLLK